MADKKITELNQLGQIDVNTADVAPLRTSPLMKHAK